MKLSRLSVAWIETQFAYIDKNAIRGVYNHAQYMDGRREMMQRYVANMDELRGVWVMLLIRI